jgi:hypothetical protein
MTSFFIFFFQGGQEINITKGKSDSRAGGEFIREPHINLSEEIIVFYFSV